MGQWPWRTISRCMMGSALARCRSALRMAVAILSNLCGCQFIRTHYSRLAEKFNRVVVENLLLLSLSNVFARDDFLGGVVPAFTVGQIGGVENLVFAEQFDFLRQQFIVGLTGDVNPARL